MVASNKPLCEDHAEQRRMLLRLKEGGGYGVLCIIRNRGGVLFAASPVPKLAGYEIVCASPERTYDVWKDGTLVTPNLGITEVKAWIKSNTPAWMYDDSDVTEKQKRLVAKWVLKLRLRYLGSMQIG